MIRDSRSAAYYLNKGFTLVRQPGVRRFVFIPLAINFLCFGIGFAFLLAQFGDFLAWSKNVLPEWAVSLMDALSWLIWPLFIVMALLLGSYFFSTIANWLAAPFNGLLSEAVQAKLTGQTPPSEPLHQMLARTFGREWTKLKYYLPKVAAMLLLWLLTFYIPGLNLLLPVLWFLFSAWMMALQYLDYPMDNHRVPFPVMLASLRARRGLALSFGSLIALLGMIPFINILVMPVAVASATALWLDEFQSTPKNP